MMIRKQKAKIVKGGCLRDEINVKSKEVDILCINFLKGYAQGVILLDMYEASCNKGAATEVRES